MEMHVEFVIGEKSKKTVKTMNIFKSYYLHNSNYLLLAIIVICNATIIPIDAIIGNNKEFSWDDASSMEFTDVEIPSVLSLMFVLAVDKVSSNPEISDFKVFNSVEVSSKIEFSLLICLLIPPRF